MVKSIMQSARYCYVCGAIRGLNLHHIYEGTANRTQSDKNGFTVYLCTRHHTSSDYGVHFDKSLDLRFKRLCQRKFERTHSREEFIKIIGKNYLGE